MVQQQISNEHNERFCLYVTIKCTAVKTFRVVVADQGKKNSKYADRLVTVMAQDKGVRDIFISFPVSPKAMVLTVYNKDAKHDQDFEVVAKKGPMKPSTAWLDSETQSFVQMAVIFSQKAGFTQPQNPYTLYKSSDDLYTIKYFDVITDKGRVLSTPARIGHATGTIEVAKQMFDKYTIPMRMIILLHEFSHKYKNPKMGLEISDETGADVNALYIYLSLGFSKIDAIYVFANVFFKAQTQGNIKRMRTIMDYIKKLEESAPALV